MFKQTVRLTLLAMTLACNGPTPSDADPALPVRGPLGGLTNLRVLVGSKAADKGNLKLQATRPRPPLHDFVSEAAWDMAADPEPLPPPESTCDGVPDTDRKLRPGAIVIRPSAIGAAELESVLAHLPSGDHRTVYLRTGIYAVPKPLVLTGDADGVTIAACPGERPLLRGAPDAPVIILRGVRGAALVGLTFPGAAPVQVLLSRASDCLVAGNTFVHAGTALLLEGAPGNAIRRNLILRAAETGIELRDGSDANLVADNVIDGAAAPETHGGGIFLHGVSGNRIAHNLVESTAGFGIGVSNWDDATVNIGNVVEYNILRNTALTAEDSGAIYILGRSGVDTQLVIAGNVVDGVGAPGQHGVGIYLDDSTGGAVVTRNLVRRVASDAVQIHGGSDNLIDNNLLDLGAGRPSAVLFQAAPADTNPLNRQEGNQVLRNVILSANPDPKLFVWYDGGTPHIAGNFYANAGGAAMPQVAPVIDETPMLGDPAVARDGMRGHYAAAQQAAAAIGFVAIDLTLAGPRLAGR